MDEIAKCAKIGPGMLYRHLPTREDLLAAVYISEVEKLAESQRKFSAESPPIEALRAWMILFIDYVAAKKIIAPALNAMACGPSQVHQHHPRHGGSCALPTSRCRSMDMLLAIYGISIAGTADDSAEKGAAVHRRPHLGLPSLYEAAIYIFVATSNGWCATGAEDC